MLISEPLGTWGDWTGLTFPSSGPHIIDGGLVPLDVNLETGIGIYNDPNVWMSHSV